MTTEEQQIYDEIIAHLIDVLLLEPPAIDPQEFRADCWRLYNAECCPYGDNEQGLEKWLAEKPLF